MTKGWKAAASACLLLLFLAAIRPATLVATRACSLEQPSGGQREAERNQSKAGVEAALSRAAFRAICGLLGEIEPSAGPDGEERSPELPKWTDEVQAWSAAVVALLTLVLLVVSGFQFRFLIRSTRATERAANAARASVDLTRETAERQLRAYVGTSRIYFRSFTPEAPVSVAVEIRNFGATPVHDYRTDLWLEVHPHPVPWPGAFVGTEAAATNRTDSLMPGNESVAICELPQGIPADLHAGIRGETFALYLCGTISYRDVFGKKQQTGVRKIAHGRRIETNSPFIDAPEGNGST